MSAQLRTLCKIHENIKYYQGSVLGEYKRVWWSTVMDKIFDTNSSLENYLREIAHFGKS